MKANYRVFFSHGSGDSHIVKKYLKPEVEQSGADVFLDEIDLEYGEDFRNRILNEIRECDELLVLLTPTSVNRPWVFTEIGAALVRDKPVIAVRYGPTNHELQERGVLSILGNIVLLEMDDFDDYVEQLAARVNGGADE